MRAFGRVIGTFLLMLAIGYVAMVLLVPPTRMPDTDETLMSGRSAAADRLTQEAAALVKSRKPITFTK